MRTYVRTGLLVLTALWAAAGCGPPATLAAGPLLTDLGALIPWFSGRRLAALGRDIKVHAGAALKLRLPEHDPEAALPSAIHGLGLLLISAMAATGAVYFVEVALGLHSAEPDGMLAMTVHLALANLVWAYLIAHAGLALLHHLLRSMRMSTMWSFGR